MASIPMVQLATVLPGAYPFKDGNVNDTYRGQIVLKGSQVRFAIIKDISPKELANELMVAAMARATGLPVPNASLAQVPAGILPAKKGPRLQDGTPLVFASEDAETPPVAQLYHGRSKEAALRIKQRLADWGDLGSLYALDTWVANVDRHHRNLLFSGDKQVWLIDHGHCFTGPNWKSGNLKAASKFANKLKSWLTPALTDAQRRKVVSQSTKYASEAEALDVARLGVANHVLDILQRQDFDALVDFLQKRHEYVPRMAAAAAGEDKLL